MHYFNVYIRGQKGIFTWSSDTFLPLGSRVVVTLRNREKIGILVKKIEKPEYKTLKIKEVLDLNFLPEFYIKLAYKMSHDYFCSVEKVMSLLVPDAFFQKKDPIVTEFFYQQNTQRGELVWRSKMQKEIQNLLIKHIEVSEKEILKISSKATLKNLVDKKYLIKKTEYRE